eukprot:CAMPEP_0197653036 /NCGR_PEP_ID=MMETSP1338-20131121/34808_1 /TAXON_ID=43686 ORGANISM="Pelagodinium beii, Strain RCC1491" /NCGR_SAMPLE_ID=MMETSP1338 /ASSEMBLY_ACC=CAM_ASM_000754 /LENGTH=452 /DNA_ID=CAMNT_0043228031 /DNA_START=79 /DNA_END=1437 /DNA_ORIENTATION=+
MRATTPRGTTPRAVTPRLSARAVTPRSGPPTQRASSAHGSGKSKFKDMTVQEMEEMLEQKFTKRMVPEKKAGQPVSARELLAENMALIQQKKESKALARKNSREFVQRLLEEDRMKIEGLKAHEQSKKSAFKELAQHYKAKIAQNEESKAAVKKAASSDTQQDYWNPFVEGEKIAKGRAVQEGRMREEMQGFLKKQRQERPPRDGIIKETKVDNVLLYPIQPKVGVPAPAPPVVPEVPDESEMKLVDENAGHMARHPVFLIKAKDHMSRRLTDDHVRKALEEKVEETKKDLIAMSQKQKGSQQTVEESLLVQDALRYDSNAAKADERRRHAQFLQKQIHERKLVKEAEKAARLGQSAGYWGPEEKPAQHEDQHRTHCSDLIKQMEVDQNRKINERDHALRLEKKMIDNCLVEMEADRAVEKEKGRQHREVLVTTWKSQQKIKEALKTIESQI